jgi:hypothetical protein
VTQHAIALELGITQPAVSKILKRAEERTLRELSATVERQKARQTLRLERLFAEAMQAWQASKAGTTRRRQRKTQSGSGGTDTSVAEITSEHPHGDPRFLDQARKASADLRKVWGLDAPQQVDVRATRSPYADLSEEQLLEVVQTQGRLLGTGGPLSPATGDHPETGTDRDHE